MRHGKAKNISQNIPIRDFIQKKHRFPYVTPADILKVLEQDGLPMHRNTFIRLEKEGFFSSRRTPSGWRIYSKKEASLIIYLIEREYAILNEV